VEVLPAAEQVEVHVCKAHLLDASHGRHLGALGVDGGGDGEAGLHRLVHGDRLGGDALLAQEFERAAAELVPADLADEEDVVSQRGELAGGDGGGGAEGEEHIIDDDLLSGVGHALRAGDDEVEVQLSDDGDCRHWCPASGESQMSSTIHAIHCSSWPSGAPYASMGLPSKWG